MSLYFKNLRCNILQIVCILKKMSTTFVLCFFIVCFVLFAVSVTIMSNT